MAQNPYVPSYHDLLWPPEPTARDNRRNHQDPLGSAKESEKEIIRKGYPRVPRRVDDYSRDPGYRRWILFAPLGTPEHDELLPKVAYDMRVATGEI